MHYAGVHVLASLIPSVSTALILASGPNYTDARSPQSTAYNIKGGQSTYNECLTSPCEVAYLNSAEDFCLWTPPHPTPSATRDMEHTLVAWCSKSAHGTRLIPDETISEVHLVITPEYVQVSGVGNLTNINVPSSGVVSASGEGDHVHSLVLSRAYGQLEQIHDWTSFVSQQQFCFRACKSSTTPSTTCPPVYDIFECLETVPGSNDPGGFKDRTGGVAEVPFPLYQENLAAPPHYSARPPSHCTTCGAIGNAQAAHAKRAMASTSDSTFTWFTSSVAPTTTDTATDTATTTISSFPTSSATTVMNSSTPFPSSPPIPTSYSFNFTSSGPSHTHRHSHSHSSALSTSVSFSNSSTSSPFGDPSVAFSISSPAPSSPSFMSTFSAYSSTDFSPSATSASDFTFTPASMSMPTSSFLTTSDEVSSSLSELSSSQPSSYPSSALSSTTIPTPSLALPPLLSSASSQNSVVLTFTTSRSQSSVPTSSATPLSSTSPNSQTQLGSQCPPPSRAAGNAGVIVPLVPLLPLMLTILAIVISSSVGVLVL